MKITVLWVFAVVCFVGAAPMWAATLYDSQDYDLYSGDFNGDGFTDILYIAKNAGGASGIALGSSSGGPSATDAPWQSWPSNYLGIQWSGNAYNVIVADFNGDRKSDLLLQAKAPGGTSYLLLAQGAGTFTTINQSLTNGVDGVNWSADQQAIVAGIFTSNHQAGVFLQATSPSGTDSVLLTDSNGLFTLAPEQSWSDGFLNLKWSTRNAAVYAADFNGDGLADLLVQQKPSWVEIDYDVPFPVPTFPALQNGIALAGSGSPIFGGSVQTWNRMSNGVDWSPLKSNLIIGDFNGDGCADVIFQAKSSSQTSYLLTAGNCKSSGLVFPSTTTATAIAANVAISADSAKLIAGYYSGSSSPSGLYIQATSPSGTDYIASTVGATITAAAHDLTRPSSSQGPLSATAIGHTPGSPLVLPDGSGVYSVPLKLPPGTAGLTPKLSLDYRSGAGDGVLGVGWTIGGYSAITRCPSTFAQDGMAAAVTLQATDQYCLDGKRLRLASGSQGADGSQYGTEIEKFSLITAHGSTGSGPAWFEVQTADGLIYEYGNTTDSLILAPGTSTPRTWALNQISDRRTNYIAFSYYNQTAFGSYHPYRIQYTGNTSQGVAAQYTVTFNYETRSYLDPMLSYFAGSAIRDDSALLSIDVANAGSLIRTYNLGYMPAPEAPQDQRTRLTSIQECDGTGTNCMVATQFSWQVQQGGWDPTPTSLSANTLGNRLVFLDLNGDGIPDALWSEPPNYNTACFALGTDAGFSGKQCTSTPFFYNSSSPTPWAEVVRQYVMDYRGDGHQEFLQFNSSTGNWELLYLNSTSNALVEQAITVTDSHGVSDMTSQIVIGVADVDGDGRDDLIYYSGQDVAGYAVAPFGLRVRLSTGTGFGPAQFVYSIGSVPSEIPCTILRGGDFAHAGRADLIVDFGANCSTSGGDTSWEVLAPGGTSQALTLTKVAQIPLASPYSYPPMIADFNGDGIDDVAYLNYSGSTLYLYTMLGTGSASAPLSASITTNVSIPNAGQVFVGDYDGDGRSDIFFGNGTWFVARSSGDPSELGGLFPSWFSTGISASAADASIGLDVEGRGLTDFVTFPVLGSSGPISISKALGPLSDLMLTATDAYNNEVQFAYVPLTETPLYVKGDTAVFPSYDYEGPRYVVSAETLTDGIGGSYGMGYSYAGAQVDRQGRGFLGFAKVYVVDSRTSFDEERQYDLTFPYTQMLVQDDLWQSNNYPVLHTVITPNMQTVSSTSNEQRYFPYVQQRTETVYEVSTGHPKDGQPITSVTENFSFDSYGNVLTDTRTVTDIDSTAPVSPYNGQSWTTTITNTPDIDPSGAVNSADVSAWCTALIDERVTSYTASSGSPVTRTVQFIPDTTPQECRIAHVIVEPNNPSYKVTEDLGFDGFGNINSDQVTGTAMSPRPTGLYWGSNGQFLHTITNPLGQTTTLGFNADFGLLSSYQDPNGIATSWSYDSFGRTSTETRPDSTKTTWSYNSCGTLGCVNSNNRTTVTENVLNADGSVQTTRNIYLDVLDRPLATSALTLSGAYDRNETQYDDFGRVHQQSFPCFWSGCATAFTSYMYDTLGRVLQTQRPVNAASGATATTNYTYSGRTKPVQDPNGHTTTLVSDVNGWLRQSADPTGYSVTLGYDAFGSKTGVTDILGNTLFTAIYVYGSQPFQTDATDMDLDLSPAVGQHRHYTYDALGEITAWTDAKGQSFGISYDALSRPLTRSEPDLFTQWTWGTGTINGSAAYNIGQLQSVCTATLGTDIAASVCDPSGYAESEGYDGVGRLVQRAIVIPSAGTFNYGLAYDGNTGLPVGLTYPTSVGGYALQLQYGYANGVLQSIQDVSDSPNVVVWTAHASDPAGDVTQETLGNGVQVTRNYDAVTGWLASVTAGLSGAANLQNQGFLYDAIGNLTQRQDNNLGLTENLYPDTLNRLDHSTGPSALQMHYDAMGNISSRSDIASGATWTYDPAHKHRVLTAGSSSYTYTYDNNGNANTRNGSAIGWSSYNYPTSISSVSGGTAETLSFAYGPDRQRWQQVYIGGTGVTETTNYIGGLLEQVSVGGGATDYRHYIYAGDEPVAVYSRQSTGANALHYLLSDHQGSVAGVVDSTGASVVNESFAPFGARRNPLTWSGSPTSTDLTTIAGISRQGYTFQTALGLSTGLNHMNGRVQDAITGRFLSPDPFVPDWSNTQDYNRYGYVNNNPLTGTDPSGFDSIIECPSCPFTSPDMSTVAAELGVMTINALSPDFGNNFDITVSFGDDPDIEGINSQQSSVGSPASPSSTAVVGQYDTSRYVQGAAQQGNRLSQDLSQYFSNVGEGDWSGALRAGAATIGHSWQDAFSTPESSAVTMMSLIPGVSLEEGAARSLVERVVGTIPGRVLSRINVSNAGWAHVLERHFMGSGSRFSIGQGELRSLLGSRQIVGSPVVRTLESAGGTRFLRQVDMRRVIGVDKFTGKDTSILSIMSDKFGNLVTAFPGVLQ